jgi:hypothetical protein
LRTYRGVLRSASFQQRGEDNHDCPKEQQVRGIKGAEVRIQQSGRRPRKERQEQEKCSAPESGPKREKSKYQR